MKKLKAKWITKTPETRLYQIPVPIIGLTGGIGTGKSTVAALFRKKGIPVIDADQLVKNIYQRTETHSFLQTHFPDVINNGVIDFKTLREIAFHDAQAKKMIEDYIYSHLPNEFKSAYASFKDPTFIVYDVPLLFEKKLNTLIDLSVCVYAPREVQLARLMERDKIGSILAEKILDQQMNIEEKRKAADLIIDNSNTQKELVVVFEKILEIL